MARGLATLTLGLKARAQWGKRCGRRYCVLHWTMWDGRYLVTGKKCISVNSRSYILNYIHYVSHLESLQAPSLKNHLTDINTRKWNVIFLIAYFSFPFVSPFYWRKQSGRKAVPSWLLGSPSGYGFSHTVAWVMGGCPGQKAVAGEFRVQPEDQTSLKGGLRGKKDTLTRAGFLWSGLPQIAFDRVEVSLINITEDVVYFCVLLSMSVGWVLTQYKKFAVFGASDALHCSLPTWLASPTKCTETRFSFRRVEVSKVGSTVVWGIRNGIRRVLSTLYSVWGKRVMLPPVLRTPLGVFTTQLLEGTWRVDLSTQLHAQIPAGSQAWFWIWFGANILYNEGHADHWPGIIHLCWPPAIDSPVQTPGFLNSEDWL